MSRAFSRCSPTRIAWLAGVLCAAGGSPAAGAGARPGESLPSQPRESTAPRTGGREVDLRPKFKSGAELRYVMTLENDGATEMPGIEPTRQTSRQQIDFRLKTVSSDPEKGSVVELIYDAIKIHLDAGATKIDYDSRKPASGKAPSSQTPSSKTPGSRTPAGKSPANRPPANKSPASTPPPGQQPANPGGLPDIDAPDVDPSEAMIGALKPLVGSKMTLTVAPDGTITNVSGGKEISSALVGQYAGPITDPQGVKDLFGPVFSVRNAKPTAHVGEKWQYVDRIDLALLGKLRLTTDHTLKSASGTRATVDFRGQIELDTEGGVEGQAFKLTDTRYEGSYVWDTEHGALEGMEQVQAFTLAGDAGGASIKVKNNGTVRIERQRH